MDSSRSAPIAVARSNGRPGRGTLRNAWPQQRASVARARQPSRVGRINSHHDAKSSPQPKFCTKRALRARLACRCSVATLRVRGPGRPASRRSRPLLEIRDVTRKSKHDSRREIARGTRQAGCGGAGRSQASVKWSTKNTSRDRPAFHRQLTTQRRINTAHTTHGAGYRLGGRQLACSVAS